MSAVVRTFAEDRNQKSETYYRVLNEVPTLAMIVIVVAVIVKPF
jgi:putative membrane protein